MGMEAANLMQGMDWLWNPPSKGSSGPTNEEQAAMKPPPECDLDLLCFAVANQKEEER